MADNRVRKPSRNVQGLPDDILREIFTRLPVKPLCKFMVVCKHWLKLLSDPYFLKLHHQTHQQEKPMLLHIGAAFDHNRRYGENRITCVDWIGDVKYRLSLPEDARYFAQPISSSCLNLICIATETRFLLFNPSKKEFVGLPQPPVPYVILILEGGFGFFAARNEYVLIRIINNRGSRIVSFEILNISTENMSSCSWRRTQNKVCPYSINTWVTRWGTLIDGVFYWIAHGSGGRIIISFNLQDEKLETLSPPESGIVRPLVSRIDSYEREHLVEHKGNLCLLYVFDAMVEIWTLKDTQNTIWTKDFSIDGSDYCYQIHVFNPLIEVNGGLLFYMTENELEDFCRKRKRCLGYYHKQSNSFWRLENMPAPVNGIFHFCLCTES